MTMDRLEELRLRTYERDVTYEEVCEFIGLAHTLSFVPRQDIANFIREQDIPNFWWLFDWWAPVPDKPKRLSTLSIVELCMHVNVPVGSVPLTFDGAMQAYHAQCLKHCKDADIDINNLNESNDARIKRKNQARMAKARAGLKVSDKNLPDPVVAARVRELEAEYKAIQAAGKEAEATMSAEVKWYQEQMMLASGRKREHVASYKQRMADVAAEKMQLTAKQ